MTAEAWVILTALFFAAYFFLRGVLSMIAAGKYRRIWFHEKTRARFAEARLCLWSMVRRGELSIHSETFKAFNGMLTFLMRRPDDYDALSDVLRRGIGGSNDKTRALWVAESATWPEGMKDVTRSFVIGLGFLAASPSRLRWARWAVSIGSVVATHVSRSYFRRLTKVVSRLLPLEAERAVERAQEELRPYAGAAA